MKIIEVNGKKYKEIKKYPHYTLFEDEHGFKECFDDFDLGLIKTVNLLELRRRLTDKIVKEDLENE